MRGGSTEPPRIVAGELFRSVTVNLFKEPEVRALNRSA